MRALFALIFTISLAACHGGCFQVAEDHAPAPSASVDLLADARTEDAQALLAPAGCAAPDRTMLVIGAPPSDRTHTALFRLDPQTGETARVGDVTCAPFSIALDRAGMIWAAGHDGRLYTIDGASGACHRTAFEPSQQGFANLYLSFVSDAAAPAGEALYASDEHDQHGDPSASRGLAILDRKTLTLRALGSYDQPGDFKDKPCSIVGTGDGRLFAECSGAELWNVTRTPDHGKLSLAPLTTNTTWLHPLQTRPMAFWGGALWSFADPCDDAGDCSRGSPVTRFEIAGSTVKKQVKPLSVIVSAATSSTCAPL